MNLTIFFSLPLTQIPFFYWLFLVTWPVFYSFCLIRTIYNFNFQKKWAMRLVSAPPTLPNLWGQWSHHKNFIFIMTCKCRKFNSILATLPLPYSIIIFFSTERRRCLNSAPFMMSSPVYLRDGATSLQWNFTNLCGDDGLGIWNTARDDIGLCFQQLCLNIPVLGIKNSFLNLLILY